MCDHGEEMTGNEFLRKLANLARRNKFALSYEANLGKGSHGKIFYGDRSTTLKDPKKELGRGLFSTMCKQLGIDPKDL